MSRHDEREIARRLADTPAGEPPPELLDRLRADIPDGLAAGLEAEDGADVETDAPPAAPTPFARPWLAAAATLVMLVAGGFLAWKLSQEVGPVDRGYVDAPPAAEQAAEPAGAAQGTDSAASPAAPEADAEPPVATPQQRVVASASRAAEERVTPRLEVRVLDSEDYGLPGATVRVEGEGETRVEFADAEGKAAFDDLPPGEYEVTSLLDGFGTVVDPIVEVPEGEETVQREIVLPMAFAEEVTVMAQAPRIDTSSSAGGAVHRVQPSSESPSRRLARPSVPPPTSGDAERGRQPAAPEPVAHAVELEEVAEPRDEDVLDKALDIPKPEAQAERLAPAEPPPPPTNPVVRTTADRLSTFGLDVDTGSFTLVRAHLEAGRMPPAAAVRVEEVVNAQPFSDPFADAPARPGETFRVTADGAPSPFAPDRSHRLLRFRVSARELPPAERKPVVLTLVVDVSGSMEGDGLELVRAGVARLLESLRPADRVALVVFSDEARQVAPHGEPEALAAAADSLATEGGTNAESGLVLAYDTAREAFDPAAVNRVVLLSDGVANVGATGPEAILERVAAAAADGIELTTVGVGMDFNDRMMETLADRGDGRYAYADAAREMERLFAEELDGTLQTVAEEARAQVEFDPRVVESWRQVGYENRAIADHEFRYDAVDAGEIGPGHSVTALYEVKLRAEPAPGRPLALRKLRWREPAGEDGEPGRFREIEERLTTEDLAASWSAAPPDLRLAAVAAELAEHLRRSPHATSAPSTLLTEARRLAAAGVPGAAELVELAEAWRRLDVPAAEAEEPGAD